MNIQKLVKHRLEELGHEQRELAAAAEVTESYISQLLTGKKALPAPASCIDKRLIQTLRACTGRGGARGQHEAQLAWWVERPARSQDRHYDDSTLHIPLGSYERCLVRMTRRKRGRNSRRLNEVLAEASSG